MAGGVGAALGVGGCDSGRRAGGAAGLPRGAAPAARPARLNRPTRPARPVLSAASSPARYAAALPLLGPGRCPCLYVFGPEIFGRNRESEGGFGFELE